MATMAPARDAAARGKQARKEVTRSSHRDWAPAADRPTAAGRAGRAGRVARARAGADPPRPHAGLGVHVLPRGGGDHGRRPRANARTPGSRHSCAATPTCPTSACSRRPTAGWSSTSTTSTRPCAARSSGTSSGWPSASRWPAVIAGSTKRTGARRPWLRSASTAAQCAASRECARSRSGTRAWSSTSSCGAGARASARSAPRRSRRRRRRPATRTACAPWTGLACAWATRIAS